jgi:hypothetical protein
MVRGCAVRALVRLVSPGLLVGLVLGAASVAPVATAKPSPSPTPSRSASPSTPASSPSSPSSRGPSAKGSSATPSKGASADQRRKSRVAAAPDPALRTTITSSPEEFSLDRDPSFTFSAPNDPGQVLKFECSLTRDDLSTPVQQGDCSTGNSTAGGVTTGHVSYADREASRHTYTFTVHAHDPAGGSVGPDTTYRWHLYTAWSPVHRPPRSGPSFNNPLGSQSAQRRNLTRVINTVRSMPGFKQPYVSSAPCPKTVAASPSVIRISLYSMTDSKFAAAMRNASLRCVSVQMLMNNHLSVLNDRAFARLQKTLKWDTTKVSFAKRCYYGCRGRGVLHTKMYLFDSQLPWHTPGATDIHDAVMFGSSNMTKNASRVQWNDLYGVRRNARLFADLNRYFGYMKLDNGFRRTKDPYTTVGPYRVTFWPVRPKSRDPEIAALRSIRCGNTGSAGAGGRSDVYINMHAWFGPRGRHFMRVVRGLYHRGCRIHILYSFMTHQVFSALKRGTGSRMSVRRTIYSTNGDRFADLYSHFKNILVSGNVGGHPGSRMVWTGSNNFTPDGDHFDEMMVRISSGKVFRAYRQHFRYMARRKSSATYARFYEPIGGGRAPKKNDDQLTILSPDAHLGDDGTPKVRD